MGGRPAVTLGATVKMWELTCRKEAKRRCGMGTPQLSGKAGGDRRGSQGQLLAWAGSS